MKRYLWLFALLASVAVGHDALAQSTTAIVVTACGTPPIPYAAGKYYGVTQDTTGKLCSSGSGGGGGGGTSSTFGAAFPTTGTAIGVTDGTNMRAVNGVAYPGGEALAVSPQGASYALLTNASASGTVQTNVAGGTYVLDLLGTFGGTTVTLTATRADGSTYTVASYTAATTPLSDPQFQVGQGTSVQATVAGGSPSGLYATLRYVGPGTSATASATQTPVALDVSTVTTLNVAVNALTAAHHGKGGWIANCNAAGTLYVNDNGTSTTTEGGSNAALQPGAGGASQKYYIAPGTATAISVTGSANGMAICGEGYN